MTPQMYDAQADSIKVEDIATNYNNRIVLERIKANEKSDSSNYLYIQNHYDEEGEGCIDYVPEGWNDMGWLGYFISKNNHLKDLYFRDFEPPSGASVSDVLEPFIMGVNNNKSITTLNFYHMDQLCGQIFTMLGPFFKNNNNLDVLTIEECILGAEGARLLALAIGSCKKSLQHVTLLNSNIADEGMVDIITALDMHTNLKYLDLDGNRLHKNGCIALLTLLTCSTTELETLDLGNVLLDDEGIDVLVPALKNCRNLDTLRLCGNPAITTKGWQQLVSILDSPNVNITDLDAKDNNVGDEVVTSFASFLRNNSSLTNLGLDSNYKITEKGWESFSKLLCDKSSINSTYLSNHTLGYGIAGVAILQPLFTLNKRNDKKEVALIKILQHHNDFDMTPFFEWEFKVLPLMIDWFEKASTVDMPEDFEPNIGPRKLSSIYQFVRGMPVLYVEARLRKELEDIKAEETQMEEEQEESEEKPLDLETKHQLSQKRKRSIMERLDQRL